MSDKPRHRTRPTPRKASSDRGGAARERYRRDAMDASHFLGLARLYAERGDLTQALECLETAAEKHDVSSELFKLRGSIHLRRQEYEAAAEAFRQALRFDPFDREAAESLGQAGYEHRGYQEALSAAVHAFLLLPGDHREAERLRRRIQTLKRLLGWGKAELAGVFRDRREHLATAFDRLQWHRERLIEEKAPADRLPPAPAAADAGHIDLAVRLRRLELWRPLSDEQILELTRIVREESRRAGDEIFFHGTAGRDLYILERGEVAIQRATSYGTFPLSEVGPGELFGEAGFLAGLERPGDAVARRPSTVLRLDAAELDRAIAREPELGMQICWSLWHALAARLRRANEGLREFFAPGSAPVSPETLLRLRRPTAAAEADVVEVSPDAKVRLFREQGLSKDELMTLAAFSQEKRYPAGAYLFQEGDEGDEMYIVLEGRAMISKYIPGGGEEALAIFERGEFFGELSLIDGAPRSADARAHGGPLTVLALDAATVAEVLFLDAAAAVEFLGLLCRLISQRLRELEEKLVGWRILSGGRGQTISA